MVDFEIDVGNRLAIACINDLYLQLHGHACLILRYIRSYLFAGDEMSQAINLQQDNRLEVSRCHWVCGFLSPAEEKEHIPTHLRCQHATSTLILK